MKYQIDIIPGKLSTNQLLQFLSSHKISRIGLSDKKGTEDSIVTVQNLLHAFPQIEILFHYSVLTHYNRDFRSLIHLFNTRIEKVVDLGVKRILIVSGSQKRNYSSINILNYVSEHKQKFASVSFACAYNPYLSGAELVLENNKLHSKLDSGIISEVYFQIGIDIESFRKGVRFVKSLDNKVKIYACLLLPDKVFLQRFSFRPWKGVFLSDMYCNDMDYRIKLTKRLLELMYKLDVEAFIELHSIKQTNLEFWVKRVPL